MDEVQTAFRTGAPFAISQSEVAPDILCTAKGLANGFPIGLTMMTEAIGATLAGGVHGTTFGGNPLACRAALATLTILRERNLYARSTALGAEIMDGSARWKAESPAGAGARADDRDRAEGADHADAARVARTRRPGPLRRRDHVPVVAASCLG